MSWHFVLNGESKGPVSTEEIQQQIDAGTLSGQDLLWKEGMEAWQELSTLNEFRVPATSAAVTTATSSPVLEKYSQVNTSSPSGTVNIEQWRGLINCAGWIKFVGIVLIVVGIPLCLYFGLGILYIYLGLKLKRAADSLRQLEIIPSEATASLISTNLGKFFKAMGICVVVSFALCIIFAIVMPIVMSLIGVASEL